MRERRDEHYDGQYDEYEHGADEDRQPIAARDALTVFYLILEHKEEPEAKRQDNGAKDEEGDEEFERHIRSLVRGI